MAYKMGRLLVVDIEATCWESAAEQAKNNQEVIEVGVVELSLRNPITIEEEWGQFVRPTTSVLSDFCMKLTGITHEQVANGESFKGLCEFLRREVKSHQTAWASWGDFDRLAFERQCAREGVRYPWGRSHFNLKALFSIVMRIEQQLGLGAALSRLGMEFEGTPHRGLDDARNIARIAVEILETARTAMYVRRGRCDH